MIGRDGPLSLIERIIRVGYLINQLIQKDEMRTTEEIETILILPAHAAV